MSPPPLVQGSSGLSSSGGGELWVLTFEQRCVFSLYLANRVWQCLSKTAQGLPFQQECEAWRGESFC